MTRWQELSPRTQLLIIAAATAEGVMRIAALADLVRRPSNRIRGSKLRWGLAITLINSFGAVPIGYFVYGRRAD